MINFKRKRRAYIMPILKSIRKFLNTFKRYAFPTYRQYLTVYDFYKEEQIKKCYEHFKEHLKSAVLLNSENIRVHAINEANENDKDPNNYYLEFGVFSGSSINFFSILSADNFIGVNGFFTSCAIFLAISDQAACFSAKISEVVSSRATT